MINRKKSFRHFITIVPNTSSINKQKQPNRKKTPTSKNGNTTQSNNAQPNNPEQTLILEQKTTLPSLRNIEWRTVKTEANKINQILLYISINHITELNEQIYARAKLVCEKIGIPSKNTKKNQNQDGKFDWKYTKKFKKICQNDKTKERCWNMYEKKGQRKKNNNTT